MISYQRATILHEHVAQAHKEYPATALEVWGGITGIGAVTAGSIGEAMRDTVPEQFAAVVASVDVAAAYAFDCWRRAYDLKREWWNKARAFERRDACRSVWVEFAKRAKDAGDIARGFGWDDSAAWTILRDVKTLRADMSAVKRIASLAGRMYASLRGSAVRRVPGMSGEVYSIEQGADIARLLPAELALLDDPFLELPLLERLGTYRAAQYAVRGTQKRTRGPLVVAIDESGSMHGARIEWAKAAAIALARVAKDDNRPMRVVHFSESCEVQELRPADPASMMQMIRTFLDGGTAISRALEVSIAEVVALELKGSRGADIICITDGVDPTVAAQEVALDHADKLGARLWTIAVECEIAKDYPIRRRAVTYEELGRDGLTDAASITKLAQAA
jgi:Mg-chelatase subunit ChlD